MVRYKEMYEHEKSAHFATEQELQRFKRMYAEAFQTTTDLKSKSISLDKVFQECVGALKEVTGEEVKGEVTDFFEKQIFKKEHEKTFIAIMAKEFLHQMIDSMERQT